LFFIDLHSADRIFRHIVPLSKSCLGHRALYMRRSQPQGICDHRH
jgi:hypothetical protein